MGRVIFKLILKNRGTISGKAVVFFYDKKVRADSDHFGYHETHFGETPSFFYIVGEYLQDHVPDDRSHLSRCNVIGHMEQFRVPSS